MISESTRKKLSIKRRLRVGEKAPCWKGGRKIIDGYVYIYSPKHPNRDKRGYVCEHRLVMEKKLGRFLNKIEVVHHIDGSRNNNSILNLVLYESDSEHHSKEHVSKKLRNKCGQFIKKQYGRN